MEHNEFIEKVRRTRVSFKLLAENEGKIFPLSDFFRKEYSILLRNFQCSYLNSNCNDYYAKNELFKKFIDCDAWKHSWHIDVTPENYEKIREIFQEKILDKMQVLEDLVDVYYLLNYEITQIKILEDERKD